MKQNDTVEKKGYRYRDDSNVSMVKIAVHLKNGPLIFIVMGVTK